MIDLLITPVLLMLLAIFSHKTTSHIFTLLYRVIKSQKIALWLVCLLYLPGTFLHESAHAISALTLFLPVTRFTILPKVVKTDQSFTVILGSVQYIKRDPLRGFLVGIAPIFAGILFFYFLPTIMHQWGTSIVMQIVLSYVAFTIASTMLSSKQDLHDAVYMIPLVIIGALVCFVLNINVLQNQLLLEIVSQMNYHLAIAVLINSSAYLVTKLLVKW